MAQSDDAPVGYFAVIAATVKALASASPPYCVIGALALGAWGRPRATYDLDLLILAASSAPEPFLKPLLSKGFRVDERWRAENPMAKDVVPRLNHPATPDFPVDLLYATSELHRSALGRRRLKHLYGVHLWVCSPEDLLLLKLQASRPRDFDDAVTIVKNPGLQLDLAYLWDWANRVGLQGELRYVLHAAEARG